MLHSKSSVPCVIICPAPHDPGAQLCASPRKCPAWPGHQLGMGHVRASLHPQLELLSIPAFRSEQHTTSQILAGHSLLLCSKAPSAVQSRPASVWLFPYKWLLTGVPEVASGNEEPLGWWESLPESLTGGLLDERGDEKFQESISNENVFQIHNEQ